MRAALLAAPTSAAHRAVLMAVMLHVGADGSPCRASVLTLAKLSGVSERRVQQVLRDLVPEHLTSTVIPGKATRYGVQPIAPLGVKPVAPHETVQGVQPTAGVKPVAPLQPIAPEGEELRARAVGEAPPDALSQNTHPSASSPAVLSVVRQATHRDQTR